MTKPNFYEQVYAVVRCIPRGQVTSYGRIAKMLGAPNAARAVGYALRATLLLGEGDPQTPVPCNRLAADGDMPERFLLQVLRNLVRHGILKSTRGRPPLRLLR